MTLSKVPKIGHVFRLAGIIEECCEKSLKDRSNLKLTTLAEAILIHPDSSWGVSELEANAVEALKRLRRWGRLSGGGYSADVVLGVVDWIDGGMQGPLPPLPAHATWNDQAGN